MVSFRSVSFFRLSQVHKTQNLTPCKNYKILLTWREKSEPLNFVRQMNVGLMKASLSPEYPYRSWYCLGRLYCTFKELKRTFIVVSFVFIAITELWSIQFTGLKSDLRFLFYRTCSKEPAFDIFSDDRSEKKSNVFQDWKNPLCRFLLTTSGITSENYKIC